MSSDFLLWWHQGQRGNLEHLSDINVFPVCKRVCACWNRGDGCVRQKPRGQSVCCPCRNLVDTIIPSRCQDRSSFVGLKTNPLNVTDWVLRFGLNWRSRVTSSGNNWESCLLVGDGGHHLPFTDSWETLADGNLLSLSHTQQPHVSLLTAPPTHPRFLSSPTHLHVSLHLCPLSDLAVASQLGDGSKWSPRLLKPEPVVFNAPLCGAKRGFGNTLPPSVFFIRMITLKICELPTSWAGVLSIQAHLL